MSLIKRLADLLFPPKCVLCGRILEAEESDLCHDCRINSPECSVSPKKLSFVNSWVAVWHYEGYVRRSLILYKFYNRRNFANCYGRLLSMKLQQEYPEGFDVLTWVPISPLRKLRRGFDQVELLANAVGRELGMIPYPLLKKHRHNRPQSRIVGEAQRRANVLGVYKSINTEQISGKRILLLDDIITTGATVGECARVLLTAGAAEIHCGAVACARRDKKSK